MACINVFLLGFIWFESIEASVYPAVVWDPWNPLFACDEPNINVRIGDTANFLCPSDEFNFFVPSSHVKLLYENLYFLGTNKEQYQACNATGMRNLLYCDGIKNNLYTITFRNIKTSADSLIFTKGETYYFIGTGFREKAKLDQTVNGSCMFIDKEGENQLRLKVYVCKDDEVGCHTCKTTGCYYKNCGNLTCSQWISDGKIYKNSSQLCSEFQRRTCKNDLAGYDDHQTRSNEVACPPEKINCSNWSSSGNLHYNTKSHICFSLKIRTCKNGFTGEDFNETRHINNTCPDILPSCSNWTTNNVSQKCIRLTTRQCEIPLAGKFKESNYTVVPCAIHLKPSITSKIETSSLTNINDTGTTVAVPVDHTESTTVTNLVTKMNDTGTTVTIPFDHIANTMATSLATEVNDEGTTMLVPVNHIQSVIATSLLTNINDPGTSLAAQVGHTASMIVTSLITKINDTGTTMPLAYLQNCNGQSSTIGGLVATVIIVFVVGILVGFLVFKWYNQNNINKVHPSKIICSSGKPETIFKVVHYSEKVDKDWRFACIDDIHVVEDREKNSTSVSNSSNFSEEIKCILAGKNLHNCALIDGILCLTSDGGKVEVYKEVPHKLVVSIVNKGFAPGEYFNKGYSPGMADNVNTC